MTAGRTVAPLAGTSPETPAVRDEAEAVPSDDQADGSSVPPTQDDDLWLEATIEETESEWWL